MIIIDNFYKMLKDEWVSIPAKQHYFTACRLERLFIQMKAFDDSDQIKQHSLRANQLEELMIRMKALAHLENDYMKRINQYLLQKRFAPQGKFQHKATPSTVTGVRGYLKAHPENFQTKNLNEKELNELILRYLFEAGEKGTLEKELENLSEYLPYHIKIRYQNQVFILEDDFTKRKEEWKITMDPLSKQWRLSSSTEGNVNKNVAYQIC